MALHDLARRLFASSALDLGRNIANIAGFSKACGICRYAAAGAGLTECHVQACRLQLTSHGAADAMRLMDNKAPAQALLLPQQISLQAAISTGHGLGGFSHVICSCR